MKKTYVNPSLLIVEIMQETPMATSNLLGDTNNVELNPSTMGGGDGGDAVKEFQDWDIWSE